MKALFELFRRFDARRIFGFIRRLLGMSRPKVKCYDLLSNHALRVEGDLVRSHRASIDSRISIHALRVEGDRVLFPQPPGHTDFYPRPPGGGRLRNKIIYTVFGQISIHALRVEGDLQESVRLGMSKFNFIHALRVEGDFNVFVRTCKIVTIISIHALRVEGDRRSSTRTRPRYNFYPRPPGGGRPAFVAP